MSAFLSTYLEDHLNLHYRASLLGSLAEGLMTKSQVSGTFVGCSSCGASSSTKDVAILCDHCGSEHELKPDASFRGEGTRLVSRSLARRRFSPTNWFLIDEDWSVADLFGHLLRLPSEMLFPKLCELAGRSVKPDAKLEDIIFWPRLLFGRKTIQPDVVVVFDSHIVFFEFKRPAGADLPPWEIAGQVSFAEMVRGRLGHDWSLFIVPGPSAKPIKTPQQYAQEARSGQDAAFQKFGFEPDIAVSVRDATDLEEKIRVMSWESFLENSDKAAELSAPPSWQTRRVRHAIREFHRARAERAGFRPLQLGSVA